MIQHDYIYGLCNRTAPNHRNHTNHSSKMRSDIKMIHHDSKYGLCTGAVPNQKNQRNQKNHSSNTEECD